MLLGRCTMFTISKAVTQSLRPCVPVCARVCPWKPQNASDASLHGGSSSTESRTQTTGVIYGAHAGPLSPVFPSVIP